MRYLWSFFIAVHSEGIFFYSLQIYCLVSDSQLHGINDFGFWISTYCVGYIVI